ncbi:MAG: hypothetical protein ACPGFB_07675 [Verrucomicrobiales bacterium]
MIPQSGEEVVVDGFGQGGSRGFGECRVLEKYPRNEAGQEAWL